MNANIYRILGWASLIFCIFYLSRYIIVIKIWKLTTKLYKRLPFFESIHMLAFAVSSPNSHYLYAPLLLLFFPAIFYYADDIVLPITVILIPIIYQVYIWIYLSIPPSVLLLGKACPATVDLREDLERRLNPYRITVLFAPSSVNPSVFSEFQKNIFEWDNLWLVKNKDWRPRAFKIIDIAPIIVADTRYPSTAIVEEVKYIIKTSQLGKVIFLIEDNVNYEDILFFRELRLKNITVVSQESLVDLIVHRGLSEVRPAPRYDKHRKKQSF